MEPLVHHTPGFEIERGDAVIDGVAVSTTQMGPKDHLVLFVKNLV
jgi:hypothetical protein